MLNIRTTEVFDDWFSALRDRRAKHRIQARIDRLQRGNPGDVKPVGSGVSELRIDYGPGYRVYYRQCGPILVILLCGGSKSTQQKDIERACALATYLDVE